MKQQEKKNYQNSGRSNGDALSDFLSKHSSPSDSKSSGKISRTVLITAIILALGIYVVQDISRISFEPVTSVVDTFNFNQPSEDLLNSMGEMLVSMGYPEMTHEELIALREEGVTATFVSNVRSLGFEDLTLDEAVLLASEGVSSTFMAMMIELGYDFTISDFVDLERAGVTAYYTSNIHDLGYRDVTKEQLIRLQQIGVTPALVQQLQAERGEDLPLEEIIRYRISNQ
jgi:hypothetical protein